MSLQQFVVGQLVLQKINRAKKVLKKPYSEYLIVGEGSGPANISPSSDAHFAQSLNCQTALQAKNFLLHAAGQARCEGEISPHKAHPQIGTPTSYHFSMNAAFFLRSLINSIPIQFSSLIFFLLLCRFGRKMTLLPSVAAVIIIGFLSAFSPNLSIYIIARVLTGFFIPGGSVQMFVLISEYVGPKWRPFAGITLWLAFAVSVVVLGAIAYFVQTWKMLTIITTAPYAICFLSFK